MRILMCNSYYYIRGGAERCFFDLTALLERHGHEVIPFSMHHERNLPSPYADYFVSNMDFPSMLAGSEGIGGRIKVAERVIYSREARRNIERLIADTRPDIAHIHGIAHEMSPSILPALKAAGIPIVQTLHDYKLLCPNTSFVSNGQVCEACKGHRYYNVVRKRCKRGSVPASLLSGIEMTVHKALQIYERNVDAFIAPSQFLANKLNDFGIQVPTVTIPNFVDTTAIDLGAEFEDFFVFAGRLSPIKGIPTLLAALEQVRGSHLFIAGTGELDKELQKAADERNLRNVTFLGQVPHKKLMQLMKCARFSVLPSEVYENYPMSAIESLACGTPVIGSRMGGIPEIVIDGQTGLLFDAGDVAGLAAAMNKLIADPGLAAQMGRNGRHRVEAVNNPERHYEETMRVYRSLVTTQTD